MSSIQSISNDLNKQQEFDTSTVINAVEAMINKAEGLKRKVSNPIIDSVYCNLNLCKLSELNEKSTIPALEIMHERLLHLSALESFPGKGDSSFVQWSDTRLNRWLVDWTLRNGKTELAKYISREKNIEVSDFKSLYHRIFYLNCCSALSTSNCSRRLIELKRHFGDKVAQRRSLGVTKIRLRFEKPRYVNYQRDFTILTGVIQSTLEFELRLQEYIELARARKVIEALTYCRKYLLSWQETHLPEIRRACALMAYPATTKCAPYKVRFSRRDCLNHLSLIYS